MKGTNKQGRLPPPPNYSRHPPYNSSTTASCQTITANSSSSFSSSSPPVKSGSSPIRLPSVVSSSNPSPKASSFSSKGSGKTKDNASRTDVLSRQTTNGSLKRSVRWEDGGSGQTGRESRGSAQSRSGGGKAVDPRRMWARYTQTVRPPHKLYEPAIDRRGGGGGGGGGEKEASREGGDGDYDRRYMLKVSLPCLSDAGCTFCVYSRQLGPVKVYVSKLREKLEKSRNVGKRPGRTILKNGASENRLSGSDRPEDRLVDRTLLPPSVLSKEVTVTNPPSDLEKHWLKLGGRSKTLDGDLSEFREDDSFWWLALKNSFKKSNPSLPHCVSSLDDLNPSSSSEADALTSNRRPIRCVTPHENLEAMHRKARQWKEKQRAWKVSKTSPRSRLSKTEVGMNGSSWSQADQMVWRQWMMHNPLPVTVHHLGAQARLLAPKRQANETEEEQADTKKEACPKVR